MRRVSPRDPNGPRFVPKESTDSAGRRIFDTYEASQPGTDSRARPLKEAAPELASAFKERAFVPRGTMERDELLAGLRESLGVLDANTDALVVAWHPLLRQAVEQVAGDGVDALVSRLRKPPGRIAANPFVGTLLERIAELHRAPAQDRREAAERVVAFVEAALATPARVSLKCLEKELEGRVDLETLLATVLASPPFLDLREKQIAETLESLRAQLRQMPGKQPEGMLWNFTRLKAEKDLIALERKRRG